MGTAVFLILLGLTIAGIVAWRVIDQRRLAAMDPAARAKVLEDRAKRREFNRQQLENRRAARRERKAGPSARDRDRIREGKRVSVPLTQVATRPADAPGALACPRCGGTQFVPRRRTATKVAFGVASLVGRPHHVECVTCGAMFKRG